jgi:hypothetical protein
MRDAASRTAIGRSSVIGVSSIQWPKIKPSSIVETMPMVIALGQSIAYMVPPYFDGTTVYAKKS